jgi:hypothetical protein
MIFKITIGEKELYFSNKQRAGSIYSKISSDKINDSDVIYSRTGKYVKHYDLLEKIFTDFNFVNDNLDNIDVEFTLDCLDTKVTIFHGNIEISNSKGEKHLLKGLYSNFEMYYCYAYEKYRIKEFGMFRDTFGTFEIASNNYMHSHCPTYTSCIHNNKVTINHHYRNFTHVCLGTSELGHLFDIRYNDILDIDLTTIFMYIDTFVRWESLEGGPHRVKSQMFGKQLGITVDTENKNMDVIMERLIRSRKLKTNMNGIMLNVDSNSISEVCEQLDFLKRDKSRCNFVYVPDKKIEYENMENSELPSNVYIICEYITVK